MEAFIQATYGISILKSIANYKQPRRDLRASPSHKYF